MNDLPDAELVALLKAGNKDAMTPLFRRYRRLLLAIAGRILWNYPEGEAEELVQEIFLEFWIKIERFDPTRSTTKAWLMKLAYSRSFDRAKFLKCHFGGRQKVFSEDTLPDPLRPHEKTQQEVEDDELARTDQDKEEVILIAFEQLKVAGAKRDTLDLQIRCMKMVFFENLPIREVAKRINESYGQTRNHYYRGLKLLRSTVEKILEERAGARLKKRIVASMNSNGAQ